MALGKYNDAVHDEDYDDDEKTSDDSDEESCLRLKEEAESKKSRNNPLLETRRHPGQRAAGS